MPKLKTGTQTRAPRSVAFYAAVLAAGAAFVMAAVFTLSALFYPELKVLLLGSALGLAGAGVLLGYLADAERLDLTESFADRAGV